VQSAGERGELELAGNGAEGRLADPGGWSVRPEDLDDTPRAFSVIRMALVLAQGLCQGADQSLHWTSSV